MLKLTKDEAAKVTNFLDGMYLFFDLDAEQMALANLASKIVGNAAFHDSKYITIIKEK